jgi:regulatory protein
LAGPRRSREPKQPLGCHDRALLLLTVRARSRHELASRLRGAGFEAEEVEAELARLEELGLVDDRAFALELAEHQLKIKRSGRRAVASALAATGVARGTIDQTLGDPGGDGDESNRALALATDRARRLTGLAPEVAFGRLVSLLARRGYDAGTARAAARRALRVDGPDD